MDAVKLMPVEYRTRSKKRATPADNLDGRQTLQLGAVAALVLAVLVGGLYVYERSVVSSKRSELTKAQARLAAVQPQVQQMKEDQASAAGRLAVVQSFTTTRMNWDKALRDFARFVPSDSFLTALQFAAPTPTVSAAAATTTTDTTTTTTAAPPASTTSTLTIAGTAPGTVGVARVLDRLALIPWLSGVSLGSASRSDTGADSFNITATVSQEP